MQIHVRTLPDIGFGRWNISNVQVAIALYQTLHLDALERYSIRKGFIKIDETILNKILDI